MCEIYSVDFSACFYNLFNVSINAFLNALNDSLFCYHKYSMNLLPHHKIVSAKTQIFDSRLWSLTLGSRINYHLFPKHTHTLHRTGTASYGPQSTKYLLTGYFAKKKKKELWHILIWYVEYHLTQFVIYFIFRSCWPETYSLLALTSWIFSLQHCVIWWNLNIFYPTHWIVERTWVTIYNS